MELEYLFLDYFSHSEFGIVTGPALCRHIRGDLLGVFPCVPTSGLAQQSSSTYSAVWHGTVASIDGTH